MNGKVIVCGDSYMSPVTHHPGKHFSELVAQRLNFDLMAYSRGGMSNGGIALQVETAITNRPDLILVGFTQADRIEYPVKDDDGTRDLTADNILYDIGLNLSTAQKHVGNNPKLVSTNIHELLDPNSEETWFHNYRNVWNAREKSDVIKRWFQHIYHAGWQTRLNSYIIYSVLHKLHLSRIPYVLCFEFIDAIRHCSWLYSSTEENRGAPIIENAVADLTSILVRDTDKPDFERDPGFHTGYRCQELLATEVLRRCRKLLNP